MAASWGSGGWGVGPWGRSEVLTSPGLTSAIGTLAATGTAPNANATLTGAIATSAAGIMNIPGLIAYYQQRGSARDTFWGIPPGFTGPTSANAALSGGAAAISVGNIAAVSQAYGFSISGEYRNMGSTSAILWTGDGLFPLPATLVAVPGVAAISSLGRITFQGASAGLSFSYRGQGSAHAQLWDLPPGFTPAASVTFTIAGTGVTSAIAFLGGSNPATVALIGRGAVTRIGKIKGSASSNWYPIVGPTTGNWSPLY